MAEEEEEKPEDGSSGAMPLSQASLQQLNMVKQQLEQEIGSLGKNLEALREAVDRFTNAGSCLKYIAPEYAGKPLMVPLTSSLYVDGKMGASQRVLVDVGTGYYVEMHVDKAKNYCDRRVKMLSEQVAKVEKLVKEKRKSLDTITGFMQHKLMKMQKEQEAAQASSSG
mmetsp:Transcript_7955/g.17676  ORF Transcript_7955/g.17676 Transcript_7955/m.17676 type:complete len:168 (+) Transcript_7955:58-561(+)